MVTIIFESHGTTLDNEAGLSSGHYDVELSELGKSQARELGERHRKTGLAAVFCSDLKRSYETAEIAFKGRDVSIIQDRRLREIDYGDMARHGEAEVKVKKIDFINSPFPKGESYQQTAVMMKSFLVDLIKQYDGQKVMIIGHRATQYGLEHLIKGVNLKQAVTAHWQWRPGWEYQLDKID